MERYLLGITVSGVVESAALYRTLETIAALRPAPAHILVLDFITCMAERTPARPDVAELWSLADRVIQVSGPRGYKFPPRYKRAKSLFLCEAQRLGLDAMFYARAGDHWSAGAPAAMLEALAEAPTLGWVFLQCVRARADGSPSIGFAHRHQHIKAGDVEAKRFVPMPGMMVRASINTDALRDEAMLEANNDTVLMTSVLARSGLNGWGIRQDVDGLIHYYLADLQDALPTVEARGRTKLNEDLHAARLAKLLKAKGLKSDVDVEVAKARRHADYARASVVTKLVDILEAPKE